MAPNFPHAQSSNSGIVSIPSLSIKTANGRCVSILNDSSSQSASPFNTPSSLPDYKRSSSLPGLIHTESSQSCSPPALPPLSALVTAVEMVSKKQEDDNKYDHLNPPAGTKTMAKRKHRCLFDNCGKAFTTSGHLARHQRIHTGEKNFACLHPGCSSRFSRQDNMMQHYRTHLSPKSRRKTNPSSTTSAKIGNSQAPATVATTHVYVHTPTSAYHHHHHPYIMHLPHQQLLMRPNHHKAVFYHTNPAAGNAFYYQQQPTTKSPFPPAATAASRHQPTNGPMIDY